MLDKLKEIKIWAFAENEDLPLENRLLLVSVVIGFFVCITVTILPIVFFSSIFAIILPAMLSVIVAAFFYLIRIKGFYEVSIVPLIIIVMLVISFIWVFINGVNGTTNLFLPSVLVLFLIILKDEKKWLLLAYFLVTVTFYFAIEYFIPQSIFQYNSREEHVIDVYIGVVLNILILFFLVRYLRDNYNRERTKVEQSKEQLKLLNKELNESNQSKDKFFSIIAHDLKNPINSINNAVVSLNEYYDEMTDNDRRECISMLKDSTANIATLLDNLLQWSQSQRKKIAFHPNEIVLEYIVSPIINLLDSIAQNKNIRLVFKSDGNTKIFGDANMLSTVFRNLISNAIKFTQEGGTIEIGTIDDNNDMLTVFVKDNGIGMTDDIKNKLFKIDESITSVGTAGESGTGLGLILCKEFVERHGGRIWVESELGKGTTFYFSLLKNN